MLGQGSPRFFAAALSLCNPGELLRWKCARLVALAIASVALVLSFFQAQIFAQFLELSGTLEQSSVQVRVAWGGATERQWEGVISVNPGSVQLLRPLGMEVDEPGTIWTDQGRVILRQRSPRQFDGADLSIESQLDGVLTLELKDQHDSEAAPTIITVPVKDLLNQPVSKELDRASNRILIRRTPGDSLRIAMQRDHLVFKPGETLRFDVSPHLLPVPTGTTLAIKAKLLSAGRAEELASKEQSHKTSEPAKTVPLSWEFELPSNEGVYDVVIEAIEPAARPWAKSKIIAQRRLQVVVVAQIAEMQDLRSSWKTVMEIDPLQSRSQDRSRAWSLFNASSNTAAPVESGPIQVVQHPLGSLLQLGARTKERDAPWTAYTLSVQRVGAPHILEVEYPSDVAQTLGISIMEPNAAGAIVPIGLDSGVHVIDESAGQARKWLRHRLIFWPRTKTPVALLANLSKETPAVFGKIRVLAGPNRLPRRFAVGDLSERAILGYMNRPLLAENFGASESLDPLSRRSFDDWQTFLDANLRLTEYLHHVGYDGQIVAVAAEGSAIYPSRLLEATPQYDSGVLFDTAQDPVRKDVLELALRLFDREGLKLVPGLQFVAPLPELEAKLRENGADVDGIRLVGAEGVPYSVLHPGRRGAAPYYNPLHPEVQAAMLDVVRELVERYRTHPSFAGIAIELCADSYAQLPGEAWPLDDTTMAAFTRETGIAVAQQGAARYAERAALVTGAHREAWLTWRAGQLTAFYRSIQRELAAARPDAVLYLTPTTLFDHAETKRRLRPALPVQLQVNDVLLGLGIDVKGIGKEAGLTLFRPHRVVLDAAPAAHGEDIELNRSPKLDTLFIDSAGQKAGSLSWHEPVKTRVESFDAKSPFGKDSTFTWLVSHISPSGLKNRQRFAHAIATLDCETLVDGGWMLPLGQEDSQADFVAAFRRLPPGKYETHSDSTRPVILRSLHTENDTFVYMVNDSHWPATLQLELNLPPGCRVEELSGRRRLPVLAGAKWEVTLEPYDLIAIRFRSPGAQILSAKLKEDASLRKALDAEVRSLQKRVANLVSPPAMQPFVNADFEQPAKASQIPGWSLVNPAVGGIEIGSEGDASPGKATGRQALRFTSNGPVVAVRSDVIPVPTTGRASVSVYLKVDDPNAQPPLRLAVEGVYQGQTYYRSANVGKGPAAFNIPGQWKQFIFSINDLPAAGLEQFRVRFDLTGPGTVWIDDVQLFDLAFTPAERLQLSKMVALVETQLQRERLGECLEELNGYWPRFLSAYVPLPAVLAQQPPAPAGTGGADEQPPGGAPQPAPKAPDKAASKPSPAEWWRLPGWKR